MQRAPTPTTSEDRVAVAVAACLEAPDLLCNPETALRAAYLIAEAAKEEEARDTLAKSQVFAPLADLLGQQDTSEALKMQVLSPTGLRLIQIFCLVGVEELCQSLFQPRPEPR